MSKLSLELQARKIDEYRSLKEPYRKTLAGLKVTVLPDVYPGGSDSELLAENMKVTRGDSVLDLCTGNGIVALKASSLGIDRVVGTDLNPAAIRNARFNAESLGFGIEFIEIDLFPDTDEKFDVITINPPYTDSQSPDKTAIMFWDKGNYVVKSFFSKLSQHLKPNGKAYITWSNFADPDLLISLANENEYKLKLIKSRDGNSGFTYFIFKVIQNR